MTNGKHLLVPVRVQALVIDDLVVLRAIPKEGVQERVAGDGRWSRERQNYIRLTNSLSAPGPQPFFGATRTAGGAKSADHLILAKGSPAMPRDKDCGVYLHWVLPPGLRHSYRLNSLDFPALPDQWLIVRFCRRGAQQTTTKAWFLDGGLVSAPDSENPANILIAKSDKYVARRAGKVVPLEGFKPADFEGERTTITAVGNRYTGSPTFTANVAENRNVFSWHDDLGDLREPDGAGKILKDFLKDAALTYLLLGWYRDTQDEPFAALPAQLKEEKAAKTPGALDVLKALGWKLDGEPPSDLSSHRCLFHGMVAHVNYWNENAYKGTMLGYPGSPSVEGALSGAKPPFKVGVGNSAEDALVSLVSSEYGGAEDKAPNLWKALEAVIYRQPESLVGSWNAAPRDNTVHQSWFTAQEAGKVWSIRPRTSREGTFPADPAKTAAQTDVKPAPEHLADLKQLNELQAAADAAARELSALQQDLYARWWTMCEKTRRAPDPDDADVDDEVEDCERLSERIKRLRVEHIGQLAQVGMKQAFLSELLPAELELHSDSAPRFWAPADPFVVVKHCGASTKHHFPNSLPCRLAVQVVTKAEVKTDVAVSGKTKEFDDAGSVTQLAASVRQHFAPRDEILTGLLKEADLVEQAVSDLVNRTLATEQPLASASAWGDWTERLVKDLTWDGKPKDLPRDRITFGSAGAQEVPPSLLAELWVRQPWSPLFIDWKIKWRPTDTSSDLGPVWRFGEYDYKPKDKESIPSEGSSVSGRSMLSPVDGRVFDEPLKMLRELLKPLPDGDKKKGLNPAFPAAVAEILGRYEGIWDTTLKELSHAGMMGQALSGFHQTLLGRDVTLPRVTPDPVRPWALKEDLSFRDSVIEALFDAPEQNAPAGERLAPPSPGKSPLDFTLLRAGAFELEELWLVDDFGQWADLLGGTSAGGSAGQVFNPRARWLNDRFVVAMPPRVVQPARLDFRFTNAADDDAKGSGANVSESGVDDGAKVSEHDPALDPVCGWIFYNALDRALALCDREGRLAGELVVVEEPGHFLVRWEGAPGHDKLDSISNPELREFARSLVETTPTKNPRLHELLELIDRALERIRPAAERREAALFGRPLALVNAHVGLELFGKAWTDPHSNDPERRPAAVAPAGTGDATLDRLRVPVRLGCAHNTEDGLVGYFKARDFPRIRSRDFARIVPAYLPKDFKSSAYVADPEQDAVRVGFGEPAPLTLLMDAWGGVQAATGLVPAKTITLAHAELDKTLARMETSFRVGPVLLQAERIALPTPLSDKGRWHFRGPSNDDATTPVAPSDPRYFDERPLVAAEGRLLLLTSEE